MGTSRGITSPYFTSPESSAPLHRARRHRAIQFSFTTRVKYNAAPIRIVEQDGAIYTARNPTPDGSLRYVVPSDPTAGVPPRRPPVGPFSLFISAPRRAWLLPSGMRRIPSMNINGGYYGERRGIPLPPVSFSPSVVPRFYRMELR